MIPLPKRGSAFFFALAAVILSLAMAPDGRAQRAGDDPVVVKKKLTTAMAGEARAADAAPVPVVRKKLPPAPAPKPAAAEAPPAAAPAVEAPQKAETQKTEPGPAAPAAGPATAPAPAPAPVAGAPAKPAETPSAAAAAPAAREPVVKKPAPPAAPPAAPKPVVSKKEPAAAEARPDKKAPSPPARPGQANAPYSILLASHRQMQNALEELPRYRQAGLAPYVVLTDVGSKGAFWRTLSGHYRSLAEALQAQKALKLTDAVVVKTPYANLVGEYGAEKDAGPLSERLSRMGYFPYTVKGPGDTVRLMVGAFPSPQAAEPSRRELEGKGVRAQTVMR
jgi:cell division septation protein DedD